MDKLSEVIEFIESEYGSSKAQMISDLLRPVSEDIEIRPGEEELITKLAEIDRLTTIRDDLIDSIDDEDVKEAAIDISGRFISIDDAIAQVENKTRQDALESELDDDVFNQLWDY